VELLAACFMPVSYLAYSSILKLEGHVPAKRRLASRVRVTLRLGVNPLETHDQRSFFNRALAVRVVM
jgi:hypothetical protein